MGNIKVKSPDSSMKKWDDSISRVPGAYKDGVSDAKDVVQAMINGQALYEEQMQKTEILRRREAGLKRIDDTFWKKRTMDKGVKRIADGMRAGRSRMAEATRKNYEILSSVNLPERTSDFETNVMNRVVGVGKALKEGWGKD